MKVKNNILENLLILENKRIIKSYIAQKKALTKVLKKKKNPF